jgi:hypothetical protein
MGKHYKLVNKKKALLEHMKDWCGCEGGIDSKGLYQLSTYNPKSKWDWYEVGGRWDGGLVTTSGENTNEAVCGEIDWKKSQIPFAFLINGKWIEKGQMGWFGMARNEKAETEWEEQVKKGVKALPKNTSVVVCDCHI